MELLIPVSDPLADNSWALRVAACNGHAECVSLLLPVSGADIILETARKARSEGHLEVAGMMESFTQARELSKQLQSKELARSVFAL